ncbi:hypothetical protein Poli38472_005627 [Pythium oligandrum]|uniref:Lysophospholipid acyltransferase n=1 Tax=Pythium oligandrum TaxID=41045 RepID=A0A8K1CGB5_PYTOL|nr:hypothetical protein Poli38472_005627 [Pythium oligandrum]|eukprot:TMW63009.1 hypothetical protein Poli38472_005627 [Pythium oligandrum]
MNATTDMAQLVHTMEQYGTLATPLEFNYFNQELGKLSGSIGFPLDQLRFAICLFLAYPLAWFQRQLHAPVAKHSLNILVGVAMAQFVYASGWLHSFVSAGITYAIVKYAPVRPMPYIVFAFNMFYVAGLHIYRMSVDYMGWSMDSTASQMLLLIKLTGFAFNYYDGIVTESTQIKSTDSPTKIKIKQSRQALSITLLPSLLQFYGYVYCFTTFLAGPAFEYREYSDAIDGIKFFHKGQRRHVSPAKAVATKFSIGVFFMAIVASFGSFANLRVILQANDPLLVKLVRVYVALFVTRSKYYFAWKLTEGATILSGVGFEGFDVNGNPKGWNGVSNVDILGFELAGSVRELSRAWNKGTQTWLERYVYNRTGNSLVATYLCSAVWHGFYPGYYLFFLSVPLATSVNRLARRHVRPYFLRIDGSDAPAKPLYDLASWVATAITINYLAVSFVVLSWTDAINGFHSMHYAGHVGLLLGYLLLSTVPVKKITKQI